MIAEFDAIFAHYRNRGLLIDSNILLLYLVGKTDSTDTFLADAKRNPCGPDDFAALELIVEKFDRLITTPHIFTEVHNLLQPEKVKRAVYPVLEKYIQTASEVQVSAADVIETQEFRMFGLTDATIIAVIALQNYLLLTDDLPLYSYLYQRGVPAIKFSHFRDRF
ncbi:MAG: hypothetical protein SF162_03655 [bacterium]|nr:hypothetical protein [bacterium]